MKKLVLILLIFITGCWNYNEINNLAITTAIAVDKENDKLKVSILIANPKKQESPSNENESAVVIYSGLGKTISEAMNEISLISPKKIYIEHLTILVISDEIAKKNLGNVLDYFLRNSESTKRFEVAIAKNSKALDVIKIMKPLESFPSQSISNNIKIASETEAKSTSTLFNDFIYDLTLIGKNPNLPSIKIIGNSNKGSKNNNLEKSNIKNYIKLDNLAIFDNDKLLGYLNTNDSKGANVINNKVSEMNIYLKCNKNYSVIKIFKLKTKKSYINKLNFELFTNGEATIIEDNCNHNLGDIKIIEKLEKKLNKKLKSIINSTISSTKKYKSDIFGFGNILYKYNPNYYKKFNNWHKTGYINTNIKISTNIKIRFKGSAKENIKEAINEK